MGRADAMCVTGYVGPSPLSRARRASATARSIRALASGERASRPFASRSLPSSPVVDRPAEEPELAAEPAARTAGEQVAPHRQPFVRAQRLVQLARGQGRGPLAPERQDLDESLRPAHGVLEASPGRESNHFVSRHSRSSRRARCSRTRRLPGLRPSSPQSSAVSTSSSSRRMNAWASDRGSPPRQPSRTAWNSSSSRASSGDFQGEGALAQWPPCVKNRSGAGSEGFGPGPARLAPPVMIDDLVPQDREEPGPDRRPILEPVERLERGEERLLDQVLGQLAPATLPRAYR